MESTVTSKNMVSIPVAISKALGIRPGWRLDWSLGTAQDEIRVRAIPDRAEQARRLWGQGGERARGRDAVAELVRERTEEAER
jgi:bifunctional DNA-binding transcriptional regulator/antitoxin component of YhaV-PrlF toxin-antitoxin module